MTGASIQAQFTATGKNMDVTTTFTKNPNKIISVGTYTIVMTTSILGQTSTEEYVSDGTEMDGTWTLNGNTLTITTVDGPQEATIVEHSATRLKLKIEISESETDQGITTSTELAATYTFEKK
jgi:hypothetical protein